MIGSRRILIYRLGSLGDTVVALPALKLIARAYPEVERWVLTNLSVSSKAASMGGVLDGMGLVHGYMQYPVGLRSAPALLALRQRIRELRPEVLIYLMEPRHRVKLLRDRLFFYSCGIRNQIGFPLSARLRNHRRISEARYEYEGERLLRCVNCLGDVGIGGEEAFDLALSAEEHARGETVLSAFAEGTPVLAASIGTKSEVNDWGDDNWKVLLDRLGGTLKGWGLVLLGAKAEKARSEGLLARWPGPGLNLCGALSVRVSAAVLAQARLYIGHDSGPMHLAAAVGTQCVAVFSSRNRPGVWFPYGQHHKVLYHEISCQGCGLEVCVDYAKACIKSITVAEVERAVLASLE